jgi:hypothetical protein
MPVEYVYNLIGYRHGGEYTIGTISKSVAAYWLKKGNKTFEEYMTSQQRELFNKNLIIPKKFQLPEWYELDDILHLNSLEFDPLNWLLVENDTTDQKVAEIFMEEHIIGEMHNPILGQMDLNARVLVYGQSFEKGCFDFGTLTTDEPFDASNVKINITQWDGIKVIDSIVYNDESFYAETGETEGKALRCWIAR